MRLAVEVSTCSAERTGIGYYTEHFVDALLATRAAGDELVLISNGKPAPELYDRWRAHLRVGGIPVRAIWMQRDVNRLLVESGADFDSSGGLRRFSATLSCVTTSRHRYTTPMPPRPSSRSKVYRSPIRERSVSRMLIRPNLACASRGVNIGSPTTGHPPR